MINPASEEELTFIKLENESDLRTDEIFLKDFILKIFLDLTKFSLIEQAKFLQVRYL